MLIDSFQTSWRSDLQQFHAALPEGASLILLIDGAFVLGIFRKLGSVCKPVLLFELLPGCSNNARDVSPFVVSFDPRDRSLSRVLAHCDGWPMISAITTRESAEQLAERLAAWCLIEVDGQKFNFRFPDTRRLPAIFDTLTPSQRRQFAGSAFEWRYIGRDGGWRNLPVKPDDDPPPTAEQATLDEHQFADLLKDSESDEVWVQLLDRGIQTHLSPSQCNSLLSNALFIAKRDGMDESTKLRWCMDCIEEACQSDLDALRRRLVKWNSDNTRSKNEIVRRTA